MIERFECKLCDFVQDYKDSPIECPGCGSKWYLIRFVDTNIKRTPNSGDNWRYSVSLGVSETQIEEARKLHPQAEWKKFGHSYRPLIKSRADKKKLMKQANFEEYDPKDFKGRE